VRLWLRTVAGNSPSGLMFSWLWRRDVCFTRCQMDWSVVDLSLKLFFHQRLSSGKDFRIIDRRFLEINDLYTSRDVL